MVEPLREAAVEEAFDEQNVSIFKRMGDVDGVWYFTDTSLLHPRRVLCHTSSDKVPYEFSVDTGENTRIEVEQEVFIFTSSLGINCEVEAVLQDISNMWDIFLL